MCELSNTTEQVLLFYVDRRGRFCRLADGATMISARALALLVGALCLPTTHALAQIWSSSQSDEAKTLHQWFASFPSKENKLFCGKLVLRYSNMDAFSNDQTQARVRWYGNLEKGEYIIKDADGFRGSLTGDVSYTFSPTEKLWALADRRDGDCFVYRTSVANNIKITQEQKHDRYKQVTVSYAIWTRELTPIERVLLAAWGQSNSKDRRGRFVLMVDPFTQKYRLVAWDWGDSSGWWSGNKVPDAIAALNMMGPQALEQMK